MIPSRLLTSGFAPRQVINLVGDVGTGLTATGTTAADALQLVNVINNVTTTPASTGVALPPCEPGSGVFIRNAGANTLTVYPISGGGGTVNGAASVTISSGGSNYFYGINTTDWVR